MHEQATACGAVPSYKILEKLRNKIVSNLYRHQHPELNFRPILVVHGEVSVHIFAVFLSLPNSGFTLFLKIVLKRD